METITQTQKTNKMEWEYYTNPSKRRKINNLLSDAASLFANCESTAAARNEAKQKEREILDSIAKIDRHFAAQCGWKDPQQMLEE